MTSQMDTLYHSQKKSNTSELTSLKTSQTILILTWESLRQAEILTPSARRSFETIKSHSESEYLCTWQAPSISSSGDVRTLGLLRNQIPIKSLRYGQENRLTRQVMSSQGKLTMGNKAGRNKTTKHAFRDALKSAGLFSNVNDIRTKEWIDCL